MKRCSLLLAIASALLTLPVGVDADGITFPKNTVYDYAAKGKLAQVRKAIASNPKLVKINHPKHGGLVWCAVFGGDLATVRHVVNRGADLNAPCRGWDDFTPLMLAAEMAKPNDPTIAAYLISKGADVKARARRGRTALHSAIRYKQRRIAELLVAKGADVKAVDNDGSTPLHVAAGANSPELIQFLVDHGADVNAGGQQGTPLSLALRANQAQAAEKLRELGAQE